MCYHRSHASWLIGLYQRAIFSRWHQSTMFHRKNCWTDDSPKNRKGLPCEAVGRLIDRISSETAPIGTKQKMMKLSCDGVGFFRFSEKCFYFGEAFHHVAGSLVELRSIVSGLVTRLVKHRSQRKWKVSAHARDVIVAVWRHEREREETCRTRHLVGGISGMSISRWLTSSDPLEMIWLLAIHCWITAVT